MNRSVSPPVVPRLGRRGWLAIVAVWAAFGLLESTNAYVSLLARGVHRGFGAALINNMPWWLFWAVPTPLAFWLARHIRLDRRYWPASVIVHAAVGFLLSLLHMLAVGTLFYYTNGSRFPGGPTAQVRSIIASYLPLDMLTYLAIIGAYLMLEYYARAREGELRSSQLAVRASRLETQMAEARLNALRMELNPHFLFNALNGISGLMCRNDNETAVKMIAQLGTLLRETLSGESSMEVKLRRELEFVGRYINLEQMRFQDRLTVRIEIAPELLDAKVPSFILQPLVENAIRHGIAPNPGPAELVIRGCRSGDVLALDVLDNGVGFTEFADRRPGGVGLSNTRARLEQLYGPSGTLLLANRPDGGACVTITLPYYASEAAHPRESTHA